MTPQLVSIYRFIVRISFLTLRHPPENLTAVIERADKMDTSHLNEAAWELESDNVIALRKKMYAVGSSLKTCAGNRLLYGVKTGLNEVYLIDSEKRNELVTSDPNCSELLKPFLRGQDIREWHCSWEGYWLLCLKSTHLAFHLRGTYKAIKHKRLHSKWFLPFLRGNWISLAMNLYCLH